MNGGIARVGVLIGAFADFLFPPLCYGCTALLPPRFKILCPACIAPLEALDAADPLYLLARERLCADGLVDDLVSLYRFEKGHELQMLLHQLKYRGSAGIGRWFGEQVGNAVRSSAPPGRFDAIIPLPLHVARKRERGYNQSEQIARGMAKALGLRVRPDVVRRVRYTSTQTVLDSDERKANMEGAFAVMPGRIEAIRDRGVLLVDDVITTGATLGACAMALRRAGARQIVACSVGVADRRNL